MTNRPPIRYYRVQVKVGHLGTGQYEVKNYYVATRASKAELFTKGWEFLPGVKWRGVLEVTEIDSGTYWRNRAEYERQQRERRRAVVIGCFPILVPVHIKGLNEVRSRYPRPDWELTVVILGDKFCAKTRPYLAMSAAQRASVIGALAVVDSVQIMNTPVQALRKLLPDVLCVRTEDLGAPTADFAKIINCNIDIIPPFKGPSASDIIRHMHTKLVKEEVRTNAPAYV